MSDKPGKVVLRRAVSGPMLALYGLGTMLGAGIYALIGEVVGTAGAHAPYAFLIAAGLAAFTGASFAEFSSRYPQAAGEAVFISAGFSSRIFPLVVGLLIVASGVVSSGVMFRSFVGYMHEFFAFPDLLGYLALALIVGALAAWGIGESLFAIAVITIVEAGALIFIIALGVFAETAPGAAVLDASAPPRALVGGVLSASVLAFYAFIGFEDMVNVAEEVKRPRRTMPKAILAALGATAVIYVAIAIVAVRAAPAEALAQSAAPMAMIFSNVTNLPGDWLSVIAIFAIANGALVQVVMASRVLYGLAAQGRISSWFGHLNEKTQTPVKATAIVVLAILFVIILPLGVLAKATSFFLLVVFTMVNIALIRVKKKEPAGERVFETPIIIPWLGAASAAAFALYSLADILLG